MKGITFHDVAKKCVTFEGIDNTMYFCHDIFNAIRVYFRLSQGYACGNFCCCVVISSR